VRRPPFFESFALHGNLAAEVFMFRMRFVVPVVAAAALAACSKSTPEAAPAAPGAPAPAAAGLTAKVLERIDAPPYSYLRLDAEGGQLWAAVPQTNLATGVQVTIANPQRMDGFESKQLSRKFEKIVFGTLGGAPTAPAGNFPPEMMKAIAAAGGTLPGAAPAAPAASAAGNMAQAHAGAAAGPADAAPVKVEKATGPNAKTVAEVWAGKAALASKEVQVRGQVVKYNGGIMGKNWLHLRDGSGTAEAKNHDLTVTTAGTAAVGDVVTVTGKVSVDRDFGAGYAYPVILEDAAVAK
jgi:hypothetical protein